MSTFQKIKMTLKIEIDCVGSKKTIRLSGRLSAEYLDELQRHLAGDPPRMALDLEGVSLVDVEVVRFLNAREAGGLELRHCPPYVREWMIREKSREE
jgi:hypothetical protein